MPPSTSTVSEFRQLIERLKKEREHHHDSIIEIDRAFDELGVKLGHKQGKQAANRKSPTQRGRKMVQLSTKRRQAAPQPSRRRAVPLVVKAKQAKTFSQTGTDFVLSFIRQKGSATTAEINKHWRSGKRPATASPILSQLLKRGEIKREPREGVRGSRYTPTTPPKKPASSTAAASTGR